MKHHCSPPSLSIPLGHRLDSSPPFTVELCLPLDKLPLRALKNQPLWLASICLKLGFTHRAALYFLRPELRTQPTLPS
jgi:hypothetical protein